jgi:hypothetical protein
VIWRHKSSVLANRVICDRGGRGMVWYQSDNPEISFCGFIVAVPQMIRTG